MNTRLRQIIIMSLISLFIFSSTSLASDINIYYDNQKLTVEPQAVIQNGRTLVPVRALLEVNDFGVEWNKDTRTVNIHKDILNINLNIGNNVAEFIEYREDLGREVSSEVYLEVAPRVINGSTYVPLRFISEAMGTPIEWDNDTKSIYLRSDRSYIYEMERSFKLVSKAIGWDSSSELKLWDENKEKVDGEQYYRFRLVSDQPTHTATIGWYFVSFNKMKVYELDIALDELVLIYSQNTSTNEVDTPEFIEKWSNHYKEELSIHREKVKNFKQLYTEVKTGRNKLETEKKLKTTLQDIRDYRDSNFIYKKSPIEDGAFEYIHRNMKESYDCYENALNTLISIINLSDRYNEKQIISLLEDAQIYYEASVESAYEATRVLGNE